MEGGGGTLQEWGGRRAVMDALPTMDCYEDMFKEITRKLYGDEGLPDMGESDHPTMRAPSDYDSESPEGGGHGALAAFGLAALMQNGFPPPPGMFSHHHHLQPESTKYRSTGEDKWISSEESLQWTCSKIATYNPAQKLFRCTECECVGFLSRVAEHWLGTHANLRVFQCPQCPYASAWARCVRMHLQRQHNVADTGDNTPGLWKENPVLEEVTKYLQRLKNKVESPGGSNASTPTSVHSGIKNEFTPSPAQNHVHSATNVTPVRSNAQPTGTENTPSKRYSCTFCPYATDRRDLFTRHENIHRDEKPFQCYVCQKQFNRADHVKKHFLRMHRDHPYDLNRIRRQPPKNSNGMYYQKYNSPQQNQPRSQNLPNQGQIHPALNIPAGFPPPPNALRGVKPPIPSPPKPQLNGCNAKSHGSKTAKKKGEKRYSCCYCTWSGVDNWCLKRHLNTHLKPFVCGLCDYKAARSERLATHVLKVHNKRACGRCSFLGEDPAQLALHMQEHHPLEHRNHRSVNNVLRTTSFVNNHSTPSLPTNFSSHDSTPSSVNTPTVRRHYEEPSTPGLWNPHGHIPGSYPLPEDSWKNANKHFGAARLFHYMEASDNSEPENEMEEEEPPPFICRECGCEFVDDTSLETHVFMHHRTTTPRAVKQDPTRSLNNNKRVTDANINLSDCSIQRGECQPSKRPRKQQQPKKLVSTAEIRVVRRAPRRRRKKRRIDFTSQLRDKYVSGYIMRKGRKCFWCRSWNEVFPYHSTSSLTLHKFWHHRREKFFCEHCQVRFRHRYQVVLHSSRAHLPKQVEPRNEQVENRNEPIRNVPEGPRLPPTQLPQIENTVLNQITIPINQNTKNISPHIVIVSDHENSLTSSNPIIITRTAEILPQLTMSNESQFIKTNNMVTRVTEIFPIHEIQDQNLKLPNFISSIHELQPSFKSNHFMIRAPDLFQNRTFQELQSVSKASTIIPVQELQTQLKTYQILTKPLETISTAKLTQELHKTAKCGPIPSIHELQTQIKSNSRTVGLSDLSTTSDINGQSVLQNRSNVQVNTMQDMQNSKTNSILTPVVDNATQVDSFIDTNVVQGSVTSIVIPSYPPSV